MSTPLPWVSVLALLALLALLEFDQFLANS
jgi:hypothetical protein